MSELPSSASVLVIGAGVHGLSTAWHLARKGTDVVVVDKTSVAAGASGIACGVVRNNYFQPAMSELMAACVEIWESDPEALHYHGTGYIALGPAAQEQDLVEVHERHQRIGYDSELITGEDAVAAHMRALYPDWRAQGLTACLHEHRGGFAFNKESMLGLADKARAAGARIVEGVEVTGLARDGSGAVTTVQTSAGDVATEQVVLAVGPWIAGLWEMLGLPDRLDVHQPDGQVVADQPMWTYWYLQEGEAMFDPASFTTADGKMSPVLHVDSDAPLHADDGTLITEEPRRVAADRRPGVHRRPVPDRHGRARLPRPLVRLALALPRPLRGRPRPLPPGALRRRRRVHCGQLPHLRLHGAQRVRGRRLQPRLQDDRGGQGDRRGARRRALGAAVSVPLRALRDRRPAPRLELPVSLELVPTWRAR
jgi:glycine/D-amino acid oxidase-like deaminating enzyme